MTKLLSKTVFRVEMNGPSNWTATHVWVQDENECQSIWLRHLRLRIPRELGAEAVEQFLIHLAVDRKLGASTQNQALQALLFLYRQVLEQDLPWLDNVTRAARPKRLPIVLNRAEVRALLARLDGLPWLVANLLYGSGLRLMEALRLRVKDLAIERGELIVRDAKGGKDRVTVLASALVAPLKGHLMRLRGWFEEERRQGRPGVSLPAALARKYPGAPAQWGCQYLSMVYTHVIGKGAKGVRSPLDRVG